MTTSIPVLSVMFMSKGRAGPQHCAMKVMMKAIIIIMMMMTKTMMMMTKTTMMMIKSNNDFFGLQKVSSCAFHVVRLRWVKMIFRGFSFIEWTNRNANTKTTANRNTEKNFTWRVQQSVSSLALYTSCPTEFKTWQKNI